MITLYTSYYKDKSEIRQKELDYCLQQNIANPLIDRIMLFCDGDNAGKEMAKTITRELDNVFPIFMPENCDVNDVFLAEGAEGLHKRAGV